jgi:GDP-L-fucose synthase
LDIQKLLITGGTGLVGSAINRTSIKCSSVDGDLRSWKNTLNIFKKEKPTEVIHCAGRIGGLGSNMNYKGEFFYDNIMINTNVIEAARLTNVKKLVCFLSTCVFPDDVKYPLTEKKVHLGEPHHSNYPYAYAKRMADIQIRAYREQYGVNYISVIPTNIYGPNDNFNIDNGHVVPSLIHKCYLAMKNNYPFYVWGSGKPLREFIYSEDVAKLTEWALDEYDEKEPIIFSTSEEISIRDVVDLIVTAMNFNGDVIWEEDKPDGQYQKPSDTTKLKTYLPDFKFTPIEVGITKSVEWFIENYEKARK